MKTKNSFSINKKTVSVIVLALMLFTFAFQWYAFAASDIVGDVNQDGQLDVKDTMLCFRHIAEITPFTDEQQKQADANHDGVVNMKDITTMQVAIGNSIILH